MVARHHICPSEGRIEEWVFRPAFCCGEKAVDVVDEPLSAGQCSKPALVSFRALCMSACVRWRPSSSAVSAGANRLPGRYGPPSLANSKWLPTPWERRP